MMGLSCWGAGSKAGSYSGKPQVRPYFMFALVEDLLSSGLSRGLGKRGSWGMRIQIRKEPARDVLSKETHWLRVHDGGLSEGDGDV